MLLRLNINSIADAHGNISIPNVAYVRVEEWCYLQIIISQTIRWFEWTPVVIDK